MIRNIAYDRHLPLHAPGDSAEGLNEQINEFQKALKSLIGLGHQDGVTIGVHDSHVKGGDVLLKPGGPIDVPGMTLVATGEVFIVGQLQTVSAYRAST